VGQAMSGGYYEEVREGQILPAGSRSQPGTLRGVGPGLCSSLDMDFREVLFRALG
jgi:hypothetical protein